MTFQVPMVGAPQVLRQFLSIGGDLASGLFQDVNLGVSSPNRHLVIFAHSQATGTINGLTVAGVPANELASVVGVNTGVRKVKAYISDVQADVADINISVGGSVGVIHYIAYAMYGANPTPTDTGTDNTHPLEKLLNVPAGGVGFAAAFDTVGGSSWAGLTQDVGGNGPSTYAYSAASDEFEVEQSGLLVRATLSGVQPGFIALSFGP